MVFAMVPRTETWANAPRVIFSTLRSGNGLLPPLLDSAQTDSRANGQRTMDRKDRTKPLAILSC